MPASAKSVGDAPLFFVRSIAFLRRPRVLTSRVESTGEALTAICAQPLTFSVASQAPQVALQSLLTAGSSGVSTLVPRFRLALTCLARAALASNSLRTMPLTTQNVSNRADRNPASYPADRHTPFIFMNIRASRTRLPDSHRDSLVQNCLGHHHARPRCHAGLATLVLTAKDASGRFVQPTFQRRAPETSCDNLPARARDGRCAFTACAPALVGERMFYLSSPKLRFFSALEPAK
jgi:hypothetical protein